MRLRAIVLASAMCLLVSPAARAADAFHEWSKRLGGGTLDMAFSTTTDSSGNVVVAGRSDSPSIDLGGGPLAGISSDVIIAKYSATGAHQWSKRLGGNGGDWANAVATDASGNVLIAGFTNSVSINLGGGSLPPVGSLWDDLIVAKFSPAGAHLWSSRQGGDGFDEARAIAADAAGNIIIAGLVGGCCSDFGAALGALDLVIGKYSPLGVTQWKKRLGGGADDSALSIDIDSAGNILVAGVSSSPSADLGGGPMPGLGADDQLIAKFSPAGTHVWSQRLGGTGIDTAVSIAADASDAVAVAGWSRSASVDLGGGPLPGAGQDDMLVAKYSFGGSHQWSKRFGGFSFDYASSVSTDASGNVVVAGSARSPSIDLGGGPLDGDQSGDLVFAKYSPSGVHRWSKRFGGGGLDHLTSVSAVGSNALVIAGYTESSSIDLGGGPLASMGGRDLIVAKFVDDVAAPVSTLDLLPIATSPPLPEGFVTGNVTDDRAGVDEVSVAFQNLATGDVSVVPADLTCSTDRRSCTFRAPVPASPGPTMVTATATDRARNVESPGPSMITIIV